MLVSTAGQLPQDHSPTPGQVSPALSNSLPPGKLLFPSYLHPISPKGTSTFPLNPYPTQIPTPAARSPSSEGPESRPQSQTAVGGRAPRSLPGGVRSRSPPRRPFLLRQLSFSGGSHRTRCLSSAPCHPGPRPPSVSPPPTSLRQGPLPVLSAPAAPRAPRSPGIPSSLRPRGRSLRVVPRSQTPDARISSGSRAHTGLPSLSPGPPLDSPRDLPACPRRSPAPTYLPNSAGRNPADLPPRPTPTRPGPQPRPPARGLHLPSAKLEFPARHRLRTSGPPRPHSPAAGPAQLRRLRLYLRRQ